MTLNTGTVDRPALVSEIMDTKAYNLIRAEAERLHLPAHYTDDLYLHDRATLCGAYGDPIPERFGWILYSAGTRLIYPREQLTQPEQWRRWNQCVLKHYADEMYYRPGSVQVYYYTGDTLLPSTIDELDDLLQPANAIQCPGCWDDDVKARVQAHYKAWSLIPIARRP